ncbi:MAG: universal stress protein [Desulfobacterales bacterium]|nr:universal stress protein [Desulfobacterales bacterium]
MQNHPKILLAVDGSDQSLNAVRYVGRLFSKKSQIVLLHVMAEIPEAFRDMHVDSSGHSEGHLLGIWKVHQEEIIDDFMQQAQALLLDADIAPEAVNVNAQSMRSGIARDIINESYEDYSALVVGRTGASKIEEITMGSVASKLVETIGHIPIIVVGESPESQKILIALDGSEGSMNAVANVGALLEPAECEVMFCHVIRPLNIQQLGTKELFKQKHEAHWIAANQRKIVPVLNEAKRRLLKAGFSEEQISSEILTHQKSRAAAIAKAAAAGGFDTIVFGRRGFTSVGDFKIGRVSRKILHFAFQPALWIGS